VSIITLVAAIGAIGAVSAFLRQAVIDYKIKGARSFKNEPFGKRFFMEHTLMDAILIGMFSNTFYSDICVRDLLTEYLIDEDSFTNTVLF
jgi:hypothetical protein